MKVKNSVRSSGEKKDTKIIQIYMPTRQHPEKEIDEQYKLIEEIIEEEKKGAYVMVMGDWKESQYKNIVGKYGLGKRNNRGY